MHGLRIRIGDTVVEVEGVGGRIWDSRTLQPCACMAGRSCWKASRLGARRVIRSKEVELRGTLMHGMPPRNDEMWDLARETFTDEALGEFVRWARNFDLPYPADLAHLAPAPRDFSDD